MDNSMLSNIIVLAEDKKLNGDKLERITAKCSDLIVKANDDSYTIVGNIKNSVIISIAFVTALRGIYHEFQDIKRREKIASKVFNIDSRLVTGDFTTFISSATKFPYFVNRFQYDASVSLNRMQALELVWGDADLRKLHDFSYARSLKVVMGNFYASTANNPEGLKQLQVVTGDMHMEQFDNLDFLNPSLYVGGNIFTKNGVYEIQSCKKKV